MKRSQSLFSFFGLNEGDENSSNKSDLDKDNATRTVWTTDSNLRSVDTAMRAVAPAGEEGVFLRPLRKTAAWFSELARKVTPTNNIDRNRNWSFFKDLMKDSKMEVSEEAISESASNSSGCDDYESLRVIRINGDVVYRGEGTRGMVISFPKERMVCRLFKAKKKGKGCDNNFKSWLTNDVNLIKRNFNYIDQVIRPLAGEDFIRLGELVKLDRGLAEYLNTKFDKIRTGYRHVQGLHADPDCEYAVMMPDACFVRQSESERPTFCIEIKPKHGFLPVTNKISPDHSIKKRVCRFCMEQYHKVKNGRWSERSRYCPIDLFSGNPQRMRHALHKLVECPQNNLIMFKDGQVIYDHESRNDVHTLLAEMFGNMNDRHGMDSPMETFFTVVIRALLHTRHAPLKVSRVLPWQVCLNTANRVEKVTNADELDRAGLPIGCILYNLLRLQVLDSMDVSGLIPLYEKVAQELKGNSWLREEWQMDGPEYDRWRARTKSNNNQPDEDSIEYACKKVRDYLIAATAKDCSILIAFQPVANSDSLTDNATCVSDQHGNNYQFNITLIDLEVKPMEKIPKHFHLEKDIIQVFMETIKTDVHQ